MSQHNVFAKALPVPDPEPLTRERLEANFRAWTHCPECDEPFSYETRYVQTIFHSREHTDWLLQQGATPEFFGSVQQVPACKACP